MRKKLRNYFIGHLLQTDDVFEIARALMVYRFNIVFTIIFILPLGSDIAFHMQRATILHSVDFLALLTLPFVMRKLKSLDVVIGTFFCIVFISNLLAFMILNPEKVDATAVLWSTFFMMLGALLLRGKMRMLFCAFLLWTPLMYVIINIGLHGQLTIDWLSEKNVADPPIYILAVPIILGIKSVWDYTGTMDEARKTITEQKAIIQEKNKEMTDSIRYAKRIQDSLLPNEKVIEKNMKELKGK